jgi:hypothetical protein
MGKKSGFGSGSGIKKPGSYIRAKKIFFGLKYLTSYFSSHSGSLLKTWPTRLHRRFASIFLKFFSCASQKNWYVTSVNNMEYVHFKVNYKIGIQYNTVRTIYSKRSDPEG